MTFAPRYFLASLALLVALVGVYAAWTAHRTQAELRAQMEQTALALAETVEIGSRNAIRSNALMEELIAQRLLDNARLIDALLARPADSADVARLAEQNRLRRVDLLDHDGHPWTPPPRGPMWMMRGPGGTSAASDHPMMRYMWGRRWAAPPEGTDGAPAASAERRFWQGSDFGVAISARSFPGLIVVHADAESIVRLREQIGVDRLLADLVSPAGAVAIGLLGPDLAVLAHSDPARTGARVTDDVLARALRERQGLSRPAGGENGVPVVEVVRPLTLEGGQPALLTIAFSTAAMRAAWSRDLRAGAALAASVLLLGAFGLGAIFYTQRHHLGDVARLEREMERRRRLAALGDVAAAFAHEVRNPLNAVSMGLQRLRGEFAAEPADEYARFVDLVQGEVRRVNAIVEQFLSLARPLPLAPAPLALDDLLREVAALVETQARATGVQVRLAIVSGLPEAVADRDHLKQVLLNLVLNALHAMKQGGVVTLAAEAGRNGIVLTVDDTGPGVPEDLRARIFDPYFTTRPDGLGLGLSIARRIVEAHGGDLHVETAPGGGARFQVRLPLGPP